MSRCYLGRSIASTANPQDHGINVVIAESEEYLMNDVLRRMASKQQPRENKGQRVEFDLYRRLWRRSWLAARLIG